MQLVANVLVSGKYAAGCSARFHPMGLTKEKGEAGFGKW